MGAETDESKYAKVCKIRSYGKMRREIVLLGAFLWKSRKNAVLDACLWKSRENRVMLCFCF